jgi:predicted dehydrogenase
LRSHSQAEVSAVCGRDATRSAEFARSQDIPASFHNINDLLDAEICDAIAIATPDSSHFDMAMAAITRGKHVFCEKPLAMNAKQSATMAKAAGAAGVVNMVAFTFRYMKALQEMKRLIYAGLIGKPYHISMQVYWGDLLAPTSLSWREQASYSAAGIWGDAGAHLLDAVSFLFAPVQEVFAQLDLVQREGGCLQPDTSDLANCLAKTKCSFEDELAKISVMISASRVSKPRGPVHELQVLGSKGALGMPLTRGNNEYLALLAAGSERWEDFPLPAEAYSDEPLALFGMMRAFVDAIISGTMQNGQDASFVDGHNAQLALEAGIESARSGKSEAVGYDLSLCPA